MNSSQLAVVPCVLFVGIGGGSASGKTTLAKLIAEKTGALYISMDNFYHCEEKIKAIQNWTAVNWDLPNALNNHAINDMMTNFRVGLSYQMTIHDHAQFTTSAGEYVDPTAVVIIEGIHAFAFDDINNRYGLKIFIECDSNTRLARRVVRDLNERGRTMEVTLDMYKHMVEPAFEKYVAPTRDIADLVIINQGDLDKNAGVDVIIQHIQGKMTV